jgi:hypothetical protein
VGILQDRSKSRARGERFRRRDGRNRAESAPQIWD